MINILNEIVEQKKQEVSQGKKSVSVKEMERHEYMNREACSLKTKLLQPNETGIIAEFKRRSPSRGMLNDWSTVENTTAGYIHAGAIALSIITDTVFFGGSLRDLHVARMHNDCPVLRKDFILDEYQIVESKFSGADVILLIAAMLTPASVARLASFAKQCGLEVLLEIHTKEELHFINDHVDIVGVNNRNLNNFTVDTARSIELYDLIPRDIIKISESGIDTPEKLLLLKQKGFQGFLMGERFMHEADPAKACSNFIQSVNSISNNNRRLIP